MVAFFDYSLTTGTVHRVCLNPDKKLDWGASWTKIRLQKHILAFYMNILKHKFRSKYTQYGLSGHRV